MGYHFDALGYGDEDTELRLTRMRSKRAASNAVDRGEQMLRDLDEEAHALRDALATNALARERVRKQQDQKLALGKDVFEEGDVIRWTKRFFNTGTHTLGDTVYTYVAVKISDGTWAVTGTTQKRLGWAGLLAFMIARGQVESADIMEPIPGRRLV